MQQPDEENIIFKTAADFINNTNYPVFLTGKAGTGKTTFLKYIRENTVKNTVVVAPTGVAAINAGGTTIHSFFQLPFGPYLPIGKKYFSSQNAADKNSLLGNLKLSTERREVMELLELLIIDEISMVRCDVLDAIDTVLRHVRKRHSRPFGGVQVLYIGDMYQLPPVIKEGEWKILNEAYANQYFFSSHVIAEQAPAFIELKKVYRQSDSAFIHLLNQVRNNEMDEAGYQLLHSRYKPDFEAPASGNYITLTTHNNKADSINSHALSKLTERQYSFNADVEGSFFENSFPADETLFLKTGAQVMFLKNDTEKIRRYYNGKIGLVKKIEDEKIWVECNQDGFIQVIEVKRETWRHIKYSLNNKTQQVEEEELGSFTQFPLRLAWAITIHKSQGLTFKNAIIDAGSAFAPGQVYVALSRCTTLDGIILHSKISQASLHSDDRIVEFAATQQKSIEQQQMLTTATRQYQQEIVYQLFDFTNADSILRDLIAWVKQNNNLGKGLVEWLDSVKDSVELFNRYSTKFTGILDNFFTQENLPDENIEFQARFKKAAEWFFVETEKIKTILLQSPAVTDNRQLAKDYNAKLQLLFDMLSYKVHLLAAFRNGFSLAIFSTQKSSFKKETFTINAFSGKSNYVSKDIPHPELYHNLREKRNELAAKKGIPLFMICTTQSIEEMAHYLPSTKEQLNQVNGFGAVKLKQYGNDFISIIRDYCEMHNLDSAMPIAMEKKVRKIKTPAKDKPDTKKTSFDLFISGKSISEISIERALAITTIEGHLAYFVETGELDINRLLDKEKQEKISSIIAASESRSLTTLKQKMPSVSFAELKWMLAFEKNKNDNIADDLPAKIVL